MVVIQRHVYRVAATLLAGSVLLCAAPGNSQPATAAAPLGAVKPATHKRLQPLVDKLVSEAGIPNAQVCVYVEDAATGSILADRNGAEPMIPASNNKLVTTAAALSLIGPDYKFKTRFYAGGKIDNGTLNGDLIIYGGGDPTISGRFQEDKLDITASMRQWAAKLKALGVTKISGNIVGDDSWYDDVYFHPNWYPGERAEYYSAEVSALNFNDNCVDINWSGKGLLPETTASYTLIPETDYVNFESEVKIVAKGRSTERYYKRGATDNNITVTGTFNVDATRLDSASIHDPALYFVTILTDVLKKEGIAVEGKPVKDRTALAKLGNVEPIFEHSDATLLQVCEVINLNSQNYYTECVAKLLGKYKIGEGSWAAGTRVMEEFCKNSDGIFSEGHVAQDGSGLSSRNRVTGKQLVSILRYMDNHGLKEAWRGTLPQGDVRGSLRRRFLDTDGGKEVSKRIFGKTGLIGGVRSLSGFVVDATGRELYYSIILNKLPNSDAPKGMAFIDKMAVELARSGN